MRSGLRRVAGAWALGAAALCGGLGGCAVNHYRVTMTPTAEGLRREVACWRGENRGVGEPFPPDRLARMARAYGKPVPESGEGTHAFEGVVVDATPDDVGGGGAVVRARTSLGTVWHYVERFGGDPDPQADVERRFRAADRISAFFVGWFGMELDGKPGWDRLKAFLEGPLRRDLRNLAVLDLTLPEGPSKDAPEADRDANFTLFLVERGYVRPDEVPALRHDGLALAGRIVARRMGVPDAEPVPASLAFLVGDRPGASLRAFSASPLVEAYWKERAREGAEVPKPDETAGRMLGELLHRELLDVRLFDDLDVLEVSLACGVEPTETNGEWRAAEGRVVWPEAALRRRGTPGLLRHAQWAVPEADVQRARFGRVLLAGDALARYVDWRAALPPAQGERWDRAIAAVTPGADVAADVAAIRLPAEDGTDLAADGRRILAETLAAAP